jgi:large subunit ribosomal protein L3
MTTSTAQRDVTALLGTKLGMTQVWDESGRVVPVTVVQVDINVVTQVRSEEKDGYTAVQLGFGAVDPRKVTKPLKGHFEKAGVSPRRHIAEVRTANAASFTLGQEITADAFTAGQLVDVTGTTKGKGFAGAMKRHGFKGFSSSHGSHRNHRHVGSIGSSSTPSRVFKGLKMAGRMGNERSTVQNIAVHSVDAEKGLLLLKGALPGNKGGVVLIRSAAKGA